MKILTYVVKMAAAVCYILIIVTAVLLAPVVAGKRPMIVLSGSMQPTFSAGSLIYMEKAGFEDIEVGDIVSYGSNQIVSHRVIGKMEHTKKLITRGDANESQDPEVPAEKVAGKIWDKVYIPYAGYMIYLLRNPVVIICMAAVIILNMIIRHVQDVSRIKGRIIEENL